MRAPHDHSHDHSHDHGRSHGHAHSHDVASVRTIELDTIVHAAFLADVTTWLRDRVGDLAVRRVLDVGSGTGAGTVALAEQFPDAEVVAADVSDVMLERVRSLAAERGLAARISTENADIAADVTRLGRFDLAWASASLHEADDPDRAFENLFAALRPGGLLTVVEMDGPPRVLPLELADLEERLHAAFEPVRQGNAYHLDWSAPLARAGFELETLRTVAIEETVDGHGPAGEFATLFLTRMMSAAASQLSAPDAAQLTALLGDGPDSLRRRSDLRLRGSRSVWLARRPEQRPRPRWTPP